jgi:hypothetical protein
MKKLLKAAACAAATLIGCANAQAADIQTKANGCGDGCTTITVAGKIRENDWKTFAGIAKAENATKTIVALASPGGELYSALRMGLLIRKAGFATVVPENMECASGCALMWLAGTPRMAGPKAAVGFHAPYSRREGRNGEAVGPAFQNPAAVSVVRKYLDKLGISKAAQSFLVSAPADDMYWLNGDLAAGFGIDYVDLKREQKQAETKTEPSPAPKGDNRVASTSLIVPPTMAKPDPVDDPLFARPPETSRELPRRVERPRHERPHRRVASRGGGRTCGIGIPYIGITLRIRC